ncbi:hypothetical protein [Sandaracinus amylolyticus]|uniref:hypothetical protein n=1 Tax=Sandaracinus amylolyticus TaxID=927083 RepID=UPI001F258223|nr:hypothetical protein [Sandaracinus amylolyticus]UJR81430.1 Hypothetical protein I5071_34880 [Sandaracinus amylolyticus]
MARAIWGTLLFVLMGASTARADERVVLVRLPAERGAEMTSALRLELAGRAAMIEGAPLEGEDPTVTAMRDEARAAGATHVVWVVFPSRVLAPAEVRVLDVARAAPAHAMTAQAWDVVDARVVAVLAASLVEAAHEEPVIVVPATVVDPEPVTPPPVAAAVEEPAPQLDEPELGASRRPATFAFSIAGLGLAHRFDGEDPRLVMGQIAFYGRVSEWAAIGLRFRGGMGWSSIEGAVFQGTFGVPSIAVSFRIPLGSVAALEMGMHAEGGLYVQAVEAPTEELVAFGIGAGAFLTLELGRHNALMFDYSIDAYGFDRSRPSMQGALTLSYQYRWD